ncbi:MAG: PKD domain-containing protein, partial [Flavobacteriales bacterium]|nr:PKD domain-containing protein [Flavobacteriales bacterium]
DFGDGTTSNQQNPIHTYSPNTPSGFYWVCLTIQSINPNGNVCTSIYCDSLYIQNQSNCQASFYYADLGNNTAHFTNTSVPMMPPPGHIIEFDLDYGDGTIDYNIGATTTHIYPSPGTYYACLTMWVQDSSGTVICTDTYCDSVTVTPGGTPCQADFTYLQDSINIITNPNGTTSVVLGNIFYFIDLSMPIGMISTWSWDMGDFGLGTYHQGTSSSSQFPVYEYDTSGTYYVCLTITTLIGGNTCSSTYCDTIYAYPGPPPTGIFVHDRIKEVNIYPNPANNVLNINMLLKQSGEVEINLINMMGQKMITNKSYLFYENSNVSMDVSSLPNGIYTIEVIIDNSKLQQKLIISK